MKKLPFLLMALLLVLDTSAQEIGLQLYSLRKQLPVDAAGSLAKIKSWGIREVEGGDTYGMEAGAFKKLLKDNGLQLVGIGVDYKDLPTGVNESIQKAKFWGANYVITYWIPHEGRAFGIDDVKKAVEVFNTVGKAYKEAGLSFCYHMHGYEFTPYESGTLFDYLITHCDPKYVNFEMDVFWVKHPGQDPAALLKKYPNRFPLMHLKDRAPGTPGNQEGNTDVESNVVLGSGDVGIAAVMKAARANGVKHFFIEDESSRSEEQIPKSLAFLKQH